MRTETVAVNEFVTRQVPGSGKTYSTVMTFEDIALHAQIRLNQGNWRQGYREGVRLVTAAPDLLHNFVCPYVKLTPDTRLSAEVVKRREHEEPYIQIRALSGTPVKTGAVDLILYRHDVLAENNEQSTDADWELISINALPAGLDSMPMGPVTMMRNQLELPGGTRAHYSSEEWARSVRFWQQYAVIKGI
ncbi:MAG: DUF3228 family protein [FCB group bacterium]|nr:DUF3228 family protein [FCB group bacterium]